MESCRCGGALCGGDRCVCGDRDRDRGVRDRGGVRDRDRGVRDRGGGVRDRGGARGVRGARGARGARGDGESASATPILTFLQLHPPVLHLLLGRLRFEQGLLSMMSLSMTLTSSLNRNPRVCRLHTFLCSRGYLPSK